MFAEDFAPFFDTSGFAVAATWNGSTSVNGILDQQYVDALGNITEGYSPVFWCASSSVVGVKHGDTLVVSSKTYKVRGVEPDGPSVTILRLEVQ